MREQISKVKKNIEMHMEWSKNTHYAEVTYEELKEIEAVIVALDEQVYQSSKLIEKDKHFLIKSNIALNKKVQELEEDNEDIRWKCADMSIKLLELGKQNKRYREGIEFGIDYLKNSDIRQVQLVVTALKSALEESK